MSVTHVNDTSTQDYAMESDESRINQPANLMVASLAGSLAHVTCKVHLIRLSVSFTLFPILSINYNSKVILQLNGTFGWK
jgi:hypothetical protein